MIPIKFKESNKLLIGFDEVKDLHVWSDKKQCVSCWKMSWKERFSALIFGKIWFAILSGETQHPVYLQCSKEYFK